jgi:malate/lactate dehydrogenase
MTSLPDYVNQHKAECELLFRTKRHSLEGKLETVSIGIIGIGNNGKEAYRRIAERYQPILDTVYLFGRRQNIFQKKDSIDFGKSRLEAIAIDPTTKREEDELQTTYKKCDLLIICVDDAANEEVLQNTKDIDEVRRLFLKNNLPHIQTLAKQCQGYQGDVFIMTNPIDEICYAFAAASQIPVSKIHGLTQLDLIRFRKLIRKFLEEDESWTKEIDSLEAYLQDVQLFGPHNDKIQTLYSQTIIPRPADDSFIPNETLKRIKGDLQHYYGSHAKQWVDEKNRYIDDNIQGLMDTLDAFFYGGIVPGKHYVHVSSYLDLTQEDIRQTIPEGIEPEFLAHARGRGIFISYRANFDATFEKVSYFPAQEAEKSLIVGPFKELYEFNEEKGILGELNLTACPPKVVLQLPLDDNPPEPHTPPIYTRRSPKLRNALIGLGAIAAVSAGALTFKSCHDEQKIPTVITEPEELTPSQQSVRLGNDYLNQGNREKANEQYRIALGQDPTNEAARVGYENTKDK